MSAHRPQRLRRLYESQPPYVWVFLLGLVGNLLSGHSHRLFLPISPDRVLLPLAVFLLWRSADRVRVRWAVVHTLMAVFVGWTFVSMVWFGNQADTSMLFALLDRTVMPFVMFVLGPVIFRDQSARDLLLKVLVITGVYLGVTGLLESIAPQLVFPRYIVDPNVGLHVDRVRGPFASSEAMAMALAICAGAAALLLSRDLPRWSPVAAGTLVLNLYCIVLTTTRSVWVGLAAGVMVALLMSAQLRRWIPLMIGAAVAGFLVVLSFMPSLVTELTERSTSALPIYDRLSSNAAALRLLGDYPLTGIGWRRFYPHGADWARQSDTLPMNNPDIEVHNVILSRAAELGIPAALVFIAILLLGPIRASLTKVANTEVVNWKVFSAFTFAAWLVAGMFGPMATPFPNYAAWLVAGVAAPEHVSRGGAETAGPVGHRESV